MKVNDSMTSTSVRSFTDFLPESSLPHWELRVIMSDQCISYVAWNTQTSEALVVDPKREDLKAYLEIAAQLPDVLWLGVIDTHTHADHITCGQELSDALKAPWIMTSLAPSPRPGLRVCKDTWLNSQSGRIEFLITPGHTPDSMTVIWGPWIFGGDTVLFGDTGRDDLPGGSATQHFESVEKIKAHLATKTQSMYLLPGHDHRGGRISSWKDQLKINSSLIQSRNDFITEASAFDAPAPALLKESLRENFK